MSLSSDGQKGRPLRQILFLQAVLITGLPILVIVAVGIFWLLPQTRADIEAHQLELARAVAGQVESYLANAAAPIEDASRLASANPPGPLDRPGMLDTHLRLSKSLKALYMVGLDGRLLTLGLTPEREGMLKDFLGFDYSHNDLFQDTIRAGRPTWSDTFLSVVGGGLSVAFALPTEDRVVIGEIDLQGLSQFLHSLVGSRELLILVVDRKGQVIADRDGQHTAQQLNVANLPIVRDSLGQTGPRAGSFEFAGQSMLGSMVPVPLTDWGVLVARPRALVYQTAWAAGKAAVMGLFTALLFGITLAVVFAARMARRFEALAVHAGEVAAGQGDAPWPKSTISEFTQLAAHLDRMGVNLRERERDLEKAQFKLLSALQQSPAGMMIADAPDGQVRLVNRAAEELFMTEESAWLGGLLSQQNRIPWKIFRADGTLCSPGEFPLTQAVQAGTTFTNVEMRVLRGDRSSRWVLVNGAPIRDGNGRILGAITVFSDVTVRKNTEDELRRAKDYTENLIRAANVLIIGLDPSGKVSFLNDMTAQTTGYSLAELRGRNWFDLLVPEDIRPQVRENFEGLLGQGRAGAFENAIVTRDGSRRIISWRNSPIRETDAVSGILAFGIDVTDQRNIEKQLLHTQKLESLGVLAGGIAHDFNNILMSVLGNAELAVRRLAPESPAIDNLRQIETAASKAADLSRQMLAYSGRGKFVVEPHDLNRIIEEMMHMLKVSISKNAVLRFNLARHLPTVEVDATQIRQIIMNLVINASEAIGDKSGTIAITTGAMDCDSGYLRNTWLNENLADGLYLFLEVADTGCGMDRETISRIFDPFFSTKFSGRGLGMAAVLGILRGHQGAIKVYSEVGKGTTFKVLLPASAKPATLFDSSHDLRPWQGKGLALVVDDEETVRAIGRTMLQELGFEVLCAADGCEGLALFREHRARIRMVLLDLTMPHMDGEEAFRELRREDPNVRVILMSGYNEQEVAHKFVGRGLGGFLQKPFRLTALRDVLRGLLG